MPLSYVVSINYLNFLYNYLGIIFLKNDILENDSRKMYTGIYNERKEMVNVGRNITNFVKLTI